MMGKLPNKYGAKTNFPGVRFTTIVSLLYLKSPFKIHWVNDTTNLMTHCETHRWNAIRLALLRSAWIDL